MKTAYIKHDIDASRDLKMIRFRARFGMAGVGFFWCFLEVLRAAGGSVEYTDDLPEAIACEFNIEKSACAEMFDYALKCNLFAVENGEIFSYRLKKDIAELEEKIEILRKNGAKKWQNKGSANAEQMQSNNNYNLNLNNSSSSTRAREESAPAVNLTEEESAANIFLYWGKQPNSGELSTALNLVADYGEANVKRAFILASDAGKTNLAYVKGILKNQKEGKGKPSNGNGGKKSEQLARAEYRISAETIESDGEAFRRAFGTGN